MKTTLYVVTLWLACHSTVVLGQTSPPPWAPVTVSQVQSQQGTQSQQETTVAAGPSVQPNADQERLARLEAETQALRAEIQRLREEPIRLPSIEATPAAMDMAAPVVPGNYTTMDQVKGEIKKSAWKKGDFSIVPYGILWGNMAYNTERVSPGSYALFVQSASLQPESEFIIDARNTRLGADIGGPQIPFFDCAPSGGKVEIDFQQNVLSTENKPTVLMRHAYVETKNEEFRLLFGQTWDVISPLNQGTINYPVGWLAGNIGYRRAQLRGERYYDFSDVSLVTAAISANQQVFEDSTTTVKGEAPNWPVIEGRIGWTLGQRGKGCQPTTVGVSGHIGNEQFDHTIYGNNNERRTWSGNIDFRMPITERLGFQAECFTGENLGAFLGGIGQGVNPFNLDPIRDTGGWFEFWYDWTPCLHSHTGYSVDNPNDHDVAFASAKTYNQYYFVNLTYDLTKQCLVGFEVSSWKTLYYDLRPGDAVRCEMAVKYSF